MPSVKWLATRVDGSYYTRYQGWCKPNVVTLIGSLIMGCQTSSESFAKGIISKRGLLKLFGICPMLGKKNIKLPIRHVAC